MSSSVLAASRGAAADYLELTKPRITLMVVLTAFVGYALGSTGSLLTGRLAATLLGTALVAAGASCLNMLLERRVDSLMLRTRNRPLPAGRLRPPEALACGLAATSAGLALLAWRTGALAAAVAFVTWASYLFLYTPLKPRTSLSTVVGALPGALPPVIGWAAARGRLEPGAFVLFAIMFLWQIPHFLAIAWIYREDYARGGLPMLPVLDPEGRITGRQAVANTMALLLVSLVPTAAGIAGRTYLAGALALGLGFTAVAVRAAVLRTPQAARWLFVASILYLVALCTLLLADH
ncbi:MAG: protoheme IX farnesyltransferase [Acidobacteria bacterium]|nr:MAG: protoheme IX farnesyltransferase [Acidobacteriota bacterium]PYQ19987.1 MAG: protoheme IX farnesyltransferase [Acidobacteriota bacterium]